MSLQTDSNSHYFDSSNEGLARWFSPLPVDVLQFNNLLKLRKISFKRSSSITILFNRGHRSYVYQNLFKVTLYKKDSSPHRIT